LSLSTNYGRIGDVLKMEILIRYRYHVKDHRWSKSKIVESTELYKTEDILFQPDHLEVNGYCKAFEKIVFIKCCIDSQLEYNFVQFLQAIGENNHFPVEISYSAIYIETLQDWKDFMIGRPDERDLG
jgi:hypothetical protein